MKLTETFRAKRGWVLRVAGGVLIAGLSILALGLLRRGEPDAVLAHAASRSCFRIPAAGPVSNERFETRYFLDFDGDHSLDVAIVTEEVSNGQVNYTVQLRLASGGDQSFTVAGPPGGLKIEMQDMTGDHIPNDVLLRPALFSSLPTVLVNDGHNHFAVLVSGADPGSFTSPANLGSRQENGQTSAFLRSSGFKAIHLPASKRTLVPQVQQSLLAPVRQSFAWGIDHVSRLDRAPPSATSI
jgi:hypothetical protein